MDVITNNIVNMETAGYKADSMVTQSFRDMLISRLNDPSVYMYSYVGPHTTGLHIDTIKTSFVQGPLVETNHTTDIALDGDAFFVIEYTPYDPETDETGDEEERYTRSGSFIVDAEGYLTTPHGQYVLGQGGRIDVGTVDFTVDTDGAIYVGGEVVDSLRLVRFENNGVLRKEGENLYRIQPGLLDEDGEELDVEPIDVIVTVKQGFLEGSNVDAARETVLMMEAYRHYEINQRIVRIFDETLGRSVN
jgi:flagellar basal-body rod protein FlgG